VSGHKTSDALAKLRNAAGAGSVQAFISISTINNCKLLSERVSRNITSYSLGCLRLSKLLGHSVLVNYTVANAVKA